MLLKTDSIHAPIKFSKIVKFPLTRIIVSALFVIIGVVVAQLTFRLKEQGAYSLSRKTGITLTITRDLT